MTTSAADFTFLTVERLCELPATAMHDLLSEKITGILFKNFLSEQETETLKSGFHDLPVNEKTKVNDGFFSYPLSFAQFTQQKAHGQLSVQDYVNIARKLENELHTHFKLNITEKLCNFLQQFTEYKEVSPIYNNEHQSYLVPFNIRELLPGQGELIAHCENLFFEEFPDFFNWLQLMNISENKLSYFVTLQESTEGGELCCFDINWANVQHRESPVLLKDKANRQINLEDANTVKRFFIKPNAGDLLLFAGGNVWHRVEKIRGKNSRITLGGFIAETTTPGKYYIWS